MLQFAAMDEDVRRLVQAIHDCPTRLVLVTAGAGTQALSDLLAVAGATRTLLEAVVPYSSAAFDEFLGQTPGQYVAAQTAGLLAGRALTRARWLEANLPVVGLACTATIVTDRPKQGAHRAYVATWQADYFRQYELRLRKGARDRVGEENVVSRLMLNALAQASGLDQALALPLLPQDRLQTAGSDFAHIARQLDRREIACFAVKEDGRLLTTVTKSLVILPGAFNPLHDGHLEMAQAAARLLGHPVAFELSAVNVDKPPLATATVLDRLAQFAGRNTVWASNAPTFLEKTRLYPNVTFVVGFDTAERILDPRYYQRSPENLLAALSEIRERGGRFLVAGRLGSDGSFHDVSELDVPPGFANLFQPIPRRQFRKDISSTELRRQGRRGSR